MEYLTKKYTLYTVYTVYIYIIQYIRLDAYLNNKILKMCSYIILIKLKSLLLKFNYHQKINLYNYDSKTTKVRACKLVPS